ncbi:hypothetical protein FACS189479_05010 [Spirochaetia bacterium]|nr:hypothetical protein FACS189479_05010 [Spirochaetia bacterium]
MAKEFAVFTKFGLKDATTAPMNKIQRGVNAAFTSMSSNAGRFGKIFSAAFAFNIANKAVNVLTNGVKTITNSLPAYLDRADSIGKSADKIGLSAEAYQRLSYAAELADVSQDKFSAAIGKLNTGLGQAAAETGTLYSGLNKLDKGLLSSLRGAKTNTEAFLFAADALANETDAGIRAAKGTALFGKSWADLYPLIMDGSAAIEKLAAAAPNVIPQSAINRAYTWNDTMTTLKKTWEGFTNIIHGAITRYITPLLVTFNEWVQNNRELINSKIDDFMQRLALFVGQAVPAIIDFAGEVRAMLPSLYVAKEFVSNLIEKVQDAIKFFKEWGPEIMIIYGFFQAWKTITGIIGGVTTAIGLMSGATTGATAAQYGLNAAIAANPIGAIITGVVLGVTALILLIARLSDKVGGLGNAFKVIGLTALEVGKVILKALVSPLTLAINFVIDLVQAVVGLVGMIPGLGSKMGAVNGAIEGYQNQFRNFAELDMSDISAIGTGYKRYKTAADAAGGEAPEARPMSDFEKAMLEWAASIRQGQEEETGAINGLKGSKVNSSAPALDYSKSGRTDFYGTVRNGF